MYDWCRKYLQYPHIPAIIKMKQTMCIHGVITDDETKIKRTLKTYPFIPNALLLKKQPEEKIVEQLQQCRWFMDEVDAVVIGTPPAAHYPMVKACLLCGKHVLVEKPMMMNVEQCADVNAVAEKKNLILNVMHSFQFASGIQKLDKIVQSGELGKIESIVELQLSNRNRRLPLWYNSLPLGLFYDEAAHFFYGAMRFGNGPLQVKNAHAQFNNGDDNTPKFLQVQLRAGDIPVQMCMNFNSPICEWGLLLLGEKKIAVYDYFKDILVLMDNDGQHYAKDVLKLSFQFSWGFWKGFVKSGLKMVGNKLLYGHDEAMKHFANAIQTGKSSPLIDKNIGMDVVRAMNEVVALIEEDRMSRSSV